MLPRGSQRQKRWRSHPPLPRQKKKEASIIKLLNCFIFSLELDFVFGGRDAKKSSFGGEFMDVTAQKCYIAPD